MELLPSAYGNVLRIFDGAMMRLWPHAILWDRKGVASSADVVVADFEFAGCTLRPWSCRGKIGRRDKGPRRVSRLPMRITGNFRYTTNLNNNFGSTTSECSVLHDIQNETTIADLVDLRHSGDNSS